MSVFGKVASLGGISKEQQRIDQARTKALVDTRDWDNHIADYSAQFLPEGAKLETAKHPTRLDAVNAAYPDEDPRKGLAGRIKEDFNWALTQPALQGYSPEQLLPALAQNAVDQMTPEVHEYTRKAESSFLGFGAESVKRLNGYEDWLAEKQGQEQAQQASDDAESNVVKKVAGWAGMGGGIAAGGMVARAGFQKVLGRAVVAVPHPVAKIVGAALIAIPEFGIGEKVWKWIEESEWGRANQQEGKFDKVDAVEWVTAIATGYGVGKAVRGGVARYAGPGVVDEMFLDGVKGVQKKAGKVLGEDIVEGVQRTKQLALPAPIVGSRAVKEEFTLTDPEKVAELAGAYKQHIEEFIGNSSLHDAAKARYAGNPTAENLQLFKNARAAFNKSSFKFGDALAAVNKLKAERELEEGFTEQFLTVGSKVGDDLVGVPQDALEVQALDRFNKVRLQGRFVKRYNPESLPPTGSLSKTEAVATIPGDDGVQAAGARATVQQGAENALYTSPVVKEAVADAESFGLGKKAEVVVVLRKKAAATPDKVAASAATKKADELAASLKEDAKVALGKLDEHGVKSYEEGVASGLSAAQSLENAVSGVVGRKAVAVGEKVSVKQVAPTVVKNAATKTAEVAAVKQLSNGALTSSKKVSLEQQLHTVSATRKQEIAAKWSTTDAEKLPPFLQVKTGKMSVDEYTALRAEQSPLVHEENLWLDLVNVDAKGGVKSPALADYYRKLQVQVHDNISTKSEEALAKAADAVQDVELTSGGNVVASAKDANVFEASLARLEKKVLEGTATAEELATHQSNQLLIRGASTVAGIMNAATKDGSGGVKASVMLGLMTPFAAAIMVLGEGSSNEADASLLSAAATEGIEFATAKLFKEELKKGLPTAVAGAKTLAAKSEALDIAVGAKVNGRVTSEHALKPDYAKAKAVNALGSVVTPKVAAELAGYKGFANPSVAWASKVQAMYNDVVNGLKLKEELWTGVKGMDKAGLKTSRKEVSAEMQGIAGRYNAEWLASTAREGKVLQYEKQVAVLEGRLLKKAGTDAEKELVKRIERYKSAIGAEREEIAKLAPLKEKFGSDYQVVIQNLAGKHASTRIALAAEDTTAFVKYPWLKDMMSSTELDTVAHVKLMMREYGKRMEAVGGRKIEGEFMHHAAHPGVDRKAQKAMLESIGGENPFSVPFMKFHSRTTDSLQMMPDVDFALERYIPDINSRIYTQEFWKKGSKTGWYWHSQHSPEVQASPALQKYWSNFREALKPAEDTWADDVSRKYAAWETFRLLAFQPSTAAKHAVKIVSDFTQNPGQFFTVMPKAMKASAKITLRDAFPQSLGRHIKLTEEEAFVDAMTRQSHQLESIADMGFGDMPKQVGGLISEAFDKSLQQLNQKGSIMIKLVEMFDRSHNVLSSMELASARRVTGTNAGGMTVHQAKYAVMANIMKNNFLGGMQNPAWANNPKLRALMMFQLTPFKIAERRAMLLSQAGGDVANASKELLVQLGNLRRDMVEGSHTFKAGLIHQALTNSKDLYGTSMTKQAMLEILAVGGIVTGGKAALNADFWDYTTHLPFIKQKSAGSDPSIALNPLVQSYYHTKGVERDDDELWVAAFLKDYFRNQAPLPSILIKGMKLSKGDIPEIYQSSKFPQFSYIFAVPGSK